jgi:hypothetical protein
VSVNYSTQTTITSTSYTDTGLSASITPTSASSKILVLVSQPTSILIFSNVTITGPLRLLRGSTDISTLAPAIGIQAGTGSNGLIYTATVLSMNYLDSPNTTSAITYKTQSLVSLNTNSAYIRFNENSSTSTITLLEIAA